jgi:hypothetical protein
VNNQPPFRNPFLCITIVYFLGAVSVISLLGIIALAFIGKEPPSALISVASGSMCSLASFLVSPPRGSVGFDERQQQYSPPPEQTRSVIASPAHAEPKAEEGRYTPQAAREDRQ